MRFFRVKTIFGFDLIFPESQLEYIHTGIVGREDPDGKSIEISVGGMTYPIFTTSDQKKLDEEVARITAMLGAVNLCSQPEPWDALNESDDQRVTSAAEVPPAEAELPAGTGE